MRVASVDIGTNSTLLLLAEVEEGGLRAVREDAVITRLGQGVDATGRLAPAATERTMACLTRYAEVLAEHRPDRIDAVATSALRDASNHEDFLRQAQAVLGVRPRIISGAEEAELTVGGALTGLDLVDGPVAVGDIGGGSTEIILGTARGGRVDAIEQVVSLDVGCVRLTERHIEQDPPTEDELAAVGAAARQVLQAGPRLVGRSLVAVGGTVTTLAAHVHQIVPYEGSRVHGRRLSRQQLAEASKSLSSLTLAERRRLPTLDPARADVITAGAVLLEELVALAAAEQLCVSDRGVRWGLALRLAKAH